MGLENFLRISTIFAEQVDSYEFLLERRESMNHHLQATDQLTYIPAVAITQVTLRHSLQKIPVVIPGEPNRICGMAQRIGYTGNRDNDLAIYRLKIKAGEDFPTITLPGFFVIEDGVFKDYEQWCDNRKTKGAVSEQSKKDVL
ncbi:MAG TPA: hypothetical protein VKV40_17335 [Ktedonobacteraceae bacterium]|nr:hypothetical protein [Ktedonobacteraceae bacterium]